MKKVKLKSNSKEECRLAFSYAVAEYHEQVNLYWKRTQYFWSLILITFSGYFVLIEFGGSTSNTFLNLGTFLIPLLGCILSVSWYFMNKGSKYWYTNWLQHIIKMEDSVYHMKLYENVINPDKYCRKFSLSAPYPYSVTGINQISCVIIFLMWLVIFTYNCVIAGQFIYLIAGVLLLVVLLLCVVGLCARKNKPDKDNKADFIHI